MANLLSYALCSLEDVKESLGIAAADLSYDNLIRRMINKSTLAIENYCGRRFIETTYTNEEYSGTGIDELVLKQRPITDTQALSLGVRDTLLNSEDWETIDSLLYFVDNSAGVLYLNFRSLSGWKRFRVTYSAGYATIPEDLAEACVSLAAYYVLNADGGNIGIQEKWEGQRKVRFTNTAISFDELLNNLGIDQILSGYSNLPVMTDR